MNFQNSSGGSALHSFQYKLKYWGISDSNSSFIRWQKNALKTITNIIL